MNHVTLIGNLGEDPKEFPSRNGKGCKFSLATQKGGVDGADWHKITVWGAAVPHCLRYLHKGSKVAVQGSIRYDSFVDRETGQKVNTTGINCYKVEFLSTRNHDITGAESIGTEDIPF